MESSNYLLQYSFSYFRSPSFNKHQPFFLNWNQQDFDVPRTTKPISRRIINFVVRVIVKKVENNFYILKYCFSNNFICLAIANMGLLELMTRYESDTSWILKYTK